MAAILSRPPCDKHNLKHNEGPAQVSIATTLELPQSCTEPSLYRVAKDKLVNTLRPRQNGRHFPDDIFKCIFLNENV